MHFGIRCIECMIRRQTKQALSLGDEKKGMAYMNDILREILNAPDDAPPPYMSSRFAECYGRYSDAGDLYEEIKRESNDYMTDKLPEIRSAIENAEDPLLMSLKYAVTGNYIDYGALAGRVSMEELDRLLLAADKNDIDMQGYERFTKELSSAEKLVYLLDNAGEAVADMLVMKEIKKLRPELDICAVVRGGPVVNDMTFKEAGYIGLDKLVRVIGSGAAMTGTMLNAISEDARNELETADFILAKGQGNFETLWGCGLNIYYLFLCKCKWLTDDIFHVPELTVMFMNERGIEKNDE